MSHYNNLVQPPELTSGLFSDGKSNFKEVFDNKFQRSPFMLPDSPLIQQIKDLEICKQTYGEIRATMLVNFGPEGRTMKGLCEEKDSPLAMVIKVLEYYVKLTKQK